MSLDDLVQFQTYKLGYTFKNINLLNESLTHSTYTASKGTEKNKFFRKLQVLGDAVLKLVAGEYVILTSGLVDEGVLTRRREILINVKAAQTTVAKNLFGIIHKGNRTNGIIKISKNIWDHPNFDEIQYHEFLKAVFGAIFLDAGGSTGIGIEKCSDIFRKVWGCFGTDRPLLELETCFPVHRKIRDYWIQMGLNSIHISVAEACVGVKFKNSDLLCEAIIHATFYNPILNKTFVESKLFKPNYQRLEFLGDSVLGLIITEFMFHKYPDDEAYSIFERTKEQINANRLRVVAQQLKLRGLVAAEPSTLFRNFDDILEAVIAAIYIDGGDDIARKFILREWKLVPVKTHFVEVTIPESSSIGRTKKVKVEVRPTLSGHHLTESEMGEFLTHSRAVKRVQLQVVEKTDCGKLKRLYNYHIGSFIRKKRRGWDLFFDISFVLVTVAVFGNTFLKIFL